MDKYSIDNTVPYWYHTCMNRPRITAANQAKIKAKKPASLPFAAFVNLLLEKALK